MRLPRIHLENLLSLGDQFWPSDGTPDKAQNWEIGNGPNPGSHLIYFVSYQHNITIIYNIYHAGPVVQAMSGGPSHAGNVWWAQSCGQSLMGPVMRATSGGPSHADNVWWAQSCR